jgi:CheY-like chemotaxis protein
MAYGFVKQSGGHIKIYSEVGHGTTIKTYLPRSTEAAAEPHHKASGGLKRGTETILVVEDDLKVQSTVTDTLVGLGYNVLKADDAQQALAVVRSGVHIDLVFTDIVMPGPLRSPDMARQAVQILPSLKVLFTSGYTQNAIVHGGRLDPGVELLSKPYSREQLAQKIRQLLGPSDEDDAVLSGASDDHPRRPSVSTVSHDRLRILVVEDDTASLDAACELLAMLGFAAQRAENAQTALVTLAAETFDVLLTDVLLPGMSGIELARHAVTMRPGLAVIFASGNEIPESEKLEFAWSALRTPYTADQLRTEIEETHRERRPRER